MPARADHDGQAEFPDGELRPRPGEAGKGKRAALSVDAAPFVSGPYPGHLRRLVRPFVPGPPGRQRYSALAALGAGTRRVTRASGHAYVDAGSARALRREVAACGRRGPATLVPGSARHQKCAAAKALAAGPGVESPHLPGYSPDLGLIERAWRPVKRGRLGCRVLPT